MCRTDRGPTQQPNVRRLALLPGPLLGLDTQRATYAHAQLCWTWTVRVGRPGPAFHHQHRPALVGTSFLPPGGNLFHNMVSPLEREVPPAARGTRSHSPTHQASNRHRRRGGNEAIWVCRRVSVASLPAGLPPTEPTGTERFAVASQLPALRLCVCPRRSVVGEPAPAGPV